MELTVKELKQILDLCDDNDTIVINDGQVPIDLNHIEIVNGEVKINLDVE